MLSAIVNMIPVIGCWGLLAAWLITDQRCQHLQANLDALKKEAEEEIEELQDELKCAEDDYADLEQELEETKEELEEVQGRCEQLVKEKAAREEDSIIIIAMVIAVTAVTVAIYTALITGSPIFCRAA